MVAAFDYLPARTRRARRRRSTRRCTALVEAAHVDHLHPDPGIAFATAADGEALTRRCFGDRVAWVDVAPSGLPARDSTSRRSSRDAPGGDRASILGGHGITAWGDTSEECEARSLDIIRTAERFIVENGRAEPFGPIDPRHASRCPNAERHARAAALLPLVRGLGLDRSSAGRPLHGQRRRARLRRAGRAPAPGGPRHVVPRSFPADKGPAPGPRPSTLCRPDRGLRASSRAARGISRGLPRLLRASRDLGQPADARGRSSDRAGAGRRDVLVRRQQADGSCRRRVLCQRDQCHARR